MKELLSLLVVLFSAAAFALPQVSEVLLSKNQAGTNFKIQYRLSAPAVVTVDVRVNGTSVGETALTNLTGDVNALCAAGLHVARWPVPAGWSAADSDVKAVVTAWATNCPPNYMVINLTNTAERIAYYASTNAFPAPLSDERWRTEYLVMRKIPAAGIEWRMGSNAYEPNLSNEDSYASRRVMLTEDYYLAIYEMTRRQHYAAQGYAGCLGYGASRSENEMQKAFVLLWNAWTNEMANVRDMPAGRISYLNLRGDTVKHSEYKSWPKDGRELNAGQINTMRSRYRVLLDLPTDAQWEFACRAGTTGQNYLNVDTIESSARLGEIAWYSANSSNATYQANFPQPVGRKEPNAFGLYDMLGNVCEWCVNWASKKATTVSTTLEVDPVGPATCEGNYAADPPTGSSYRANRGGNFASGAGLVRSGATYGNGQGWGDGRDLGSPTGYSTESRRYANGYRLWAPAQAVR